MVRVRQKLGKFRVDRRVSEGGFAAVFQAYDTITGLSVALKVPHESLVTRAMLEDFRKEVRLSAGLDHPNILPVKEASFIDGQFVIVYPLGEESLADRLERRIAPRTALDFADQMLQAVSFAHQHLIMHCDIKPENFILFEGNRLRLADFGIARVTQRTLEASGSGTVGYMAPEQAMGRPSFRSDVFSLGLIIYRMLSGHWPEWPYSWPLPGIDRVRKGVSNDFVAFLKKSLDINHRKRFADAVQMYAAFQRVRPRALRNIASARKRRKKSSTARDWRTIQWQEFLKRYRTSLRLRSQCRRCGGPVSHPMQVCPWCGSDRKNPAEEAQFPARCPRCKRGVKTDWRYCAWCHGPAINPEATPRYSDARYEGRCSNTACPGRDLMPFMQYCPWCKRRVRKKWPIPGSKDRCPRCGWGVVGDFWHYCAWCGRTLRKK